MKNIFDLILKELTKNNFDIIFFDHNRPWGGFFVIAEEQAQDFANQYFEGLDVSTLKRGGALSPKILVVAPEKRLSWQYHHRRVEIWRVIQGQAGVKRSSTDNEGELEVLNVGDTITLQQGERHRLIGLDDYAVIAEIWQHTDASHPSDEEDIVRVQDDFGR
jgi:mannose-6-phosphate isomerase-like protein (cupin superfamily)